jgi:diacylglycerol kinase (ATP)
MRILRDAGHGVEAAPTTGPGTAAAIARECIQSGADLILAAGGDGTINEVVNGMVYSDVPLGILPAGTANVLAMELGIGTRMSKVAAGIAGYAAERVALGRLQSAANPEGRYFLLMAGVGLDAHIVYNINASLKAALGKVAYWVGGFSRLGERLPEFTADVDGTSYRCSFALVTRVRNYGGDLEIAPTASLLDPAFEVVLFSGDKAFAYLKYMLGIVARRLEGMRGVTILRARNVRCEAPSDGRIYVQVDGEFAGRLPASLEIVPDAVTLLVPRDFRTRRPATSDEQAWTISPTR